MANMATSPSMKQKIALGLSALAVIGMGSVTLACSPRSEKPAETSDTAPATPIEKHVRVDPDPGGGDNGSACGFGPEGGLPCNSNHKP